MVSTNIFLVLHHPHVIAFYSLPYNSFFLFEILSIFQESKEKVLLLTPEFIKEIVILDKGKVSSTSKPNIIGEMEGKRKLIFMKDGLILLRVRGGNLKTIVSRRPKGGKRFLVKSLFVIFI